MVSYGNDIFETWSEGKAFAVIDTGTTMICVPYDLFQTIMATWNSDIGNDGHFECSNTVIDAGGFCESDLPCSSYYDKLQPIKFQIDDTIFELGPQGYLVDARGQVDPKTNKTDQFCMFGITPMPKVIQDS